MRKVTGGRRAPRAAVELQWGRNLTVAEGVIVITPHEPCFLLQWGRNLTVAEGPRATPPNE